MRVQIGAKSVFIIVRNTHEYTESNNNGVLSWSKSYVYLGDSILSTTTPNGQGGESIEYNHPDALGTRLVSNPQTGAVTENINLPFGVQIANESTNTTNKRKFTSYDRSTITGLDYAQNRTYDSKLGRFTQVDPIGMAAVSPMNPQTLNLYSYCGNDPINNVDPTGLFWGKLFRGILKVLTNKWFQVALAVAITVLTAGAAGPLVITNFVAGTYAATTAGSLTAVLAATLFVGRVASIANSFSNKGDDEVIRIETRCPEVGTTPLCPGNGRRGVGQPGFWVSLIPVLGSGWSAIDHFQNGEWGWGIFQTILAITDIFLVKSIVMAGGKLFVKGGAKLLAREVVEEGLTTPSKYFGRKTYGEVEQILTKEFGQPKGVGPYNKSFYDIKSERSFNLHQDPTHHGGRPHVDIRRRRFPNSRPPYFLKP